MNILLQKRIIMHSISDIPQEVIWSKNVTLITDEGISRAVAWMVSVIRKLNIRVRHIYVSLSQTGSGRLRFCLQRIQT